MREKRQREETFLPPVPLESSVVLARDYLLTYLLQSNNGGDDPSFNAGLDNPEAIAAVNAGGVIDWSHPLNLSRNTTEQSQDCEFRTLDKIAPARQGLWKTLSLSLRERRGAVEDETSRCAIRTAKEPFANSIQTAATAEHGTSVFFFEESLFVAKLAIIHRKM
jgi:hypothetical protein